MILDLDRYVAAARPVWQELEKALEHLEQDPDPDWTVEQTEQFYRLYQMTSAHLAEVRHLTAERGAAAAVVAVVHGGVSGSGAAACPGAGGERCHLPDRVAVRRGDPAD